jgi:hypothetical protein
VQSGATEHEKGHVLEVPPSWDIPSWEGTAVYTEEALKRSKIIVGMDGKWDQDTRTI